MSISTPSTWTASLRHARFHTHARARTRARTHTRTHTRARAHARTLTRTHLDTQALTRAGAHERAHASVRAQPHHSTAQRPPLGSKAIDAPRVPSQAESPCSRLAPACRCSRARPPSGSCSPPHAPTRRARVFVCARPRCARAFVTVMGFFRRSSFGASRTHRPYLQPCSRTLARAYVRADRLRGVRSFGVCWAHS